MKQSEIALKTGISPSYVCDILHLRRKPSAEKALKLEKVTGVSFKAWLLPDEYFNEFVYQVLGSKYKLAPGKPKTQ